MADLTVLSPSPIPLYTHPSLSSSALINEQHRRHSLAAAALTSGPRFASKSLINVSRAPPLRHSTLPAASPSTSKLTLDCSSSPPPPSPPPKPRPRTISEYPTAPSSPNTLAFLRRSSTGDIHSPSTTPLPSPPTTPHSQHDYSVNEHSHTPWPDYPQSRSTTTTTTPPPYHHESPHVVLVASPPTSTMLFPPVDKHRAPPSQQRRTHARKRSSSAPPARIDFDDHHHHYHRTPRHLDPKDEEENEMLVYNDEFGSIWKRKRLRVSSNSGGINGFGGGGGGGSSSYNETKDGLRELSLPPPPLLRPTTFWNHTPRSGVSAASYSPASHLIRRSTFVAAGLSYETPGHDLSALCVESRTGRNKVVVKPGEQLVIASH